jgi:hypothetical protein
MGRMPGRISGKMAADARERAHSLGPGAGVSAPDFTVRNIESLNARARGGHPSQPSESAIRVGHPSQRP